jgi:hypothetical protein
MEFGLWYFVGMGVVLAALIGVFVFLKMKKGED